MRVKNQLQRDQLPKLLQAQPGLKAQELMAKLGASQPTISRMLRELGDQVLAVGRGPSRCYYWRRSLRGVPGRFPVYAVDKDGRAGHVGQIDLVWPDGSVLDVLAMGWPVDEEYRRGFWPGLPYPLQDMRPQGFLGRSFARLVAADLGVSSNPVEWGDDDTLHILTLRGVDTSGNLIVGDVALQQWLDSKGSRPPPLQGNELVQAYADLADKASALGGAGSSAGGEFPKFTARRESPAGQDGTPHVIVKYSGERDAGAEGGAVSRWADLLVCEHLGLEHARLLGVAAARSRVLEVGPRIMLEVERFDRHGEWGRSPLCSLSSVDDAMIGQATQNWTDLAQRLLALKLIDAACASMIQRIWWYGQLIGNSDMHKGNLSFVPGKRLELAPVYDMLPMMYAPMGGGELPRLQYEVRLPKPLEREAWMAACSAALAFWEAAAGHTGISEDFRGVCADNLRRLSAAKELA